MTYSDETLKGYLNGALTETESEAVELSLSADIALQRRLMALDTASFPVAEAFKKLPGEERLQKLRATLPQQAPSKPRWLAGAALAASVAVGIFVGSQLSSSGTGVTNDWRVEVARYQALYVPETVAYLGGDPDKLATEIDRASKAVGYDLNLSTLAEVDDLTLRRAQVLGFEGQPLIQLVYTNEDGAPFALCIMPNPEGEEGPARLAGLATHTWKSGSHGFILVGGQEQGKVDDLVGRLRSGALKSL